LKENVYKHKEDVKKFNEQKEQHNVIEI
jgi:hypothetical protein